MELAKKETQRPEEQNRGLKINLHTYDHLILDKKYQKYILTKRQSL